jgi:hypothetical protein
MSYGQLKESKIEIEHLQHLLEHARTRLTRDFEHWYVHVYLETPSNNIDSNLTQSISSPSLTDNIQSIVRKSEVNTQRSIIQNTSNTILTPNVIPEIPTHAKTKIQADIEAFYRCQRELNSSLSKKK